MVDDHHIDRQLAGLKPDADLVLQRPHDHVHLIVALARRRLVLRAVEREIEASLKAGQVETGLRIGSERSLANSGIDMCPKWMIFLFGTGSKVLSA